ncbi:hypothetical protein N7478_008637 [Penicillium angulare]|uniref:uncharacterized protein n=1 Tax=Penicillium angulare TaxID=116970 RepID=UPI00254226F4|nr:uncharacterized protein N7478_008637 [Penicillium angulare]KAJ5273512.1 hypothetical protein N7478_008637 [Penicillium angulare]
MTRGFAAIAPECGLAFDEVKETTNINYVLYEASAHDKKISVAESGNYENYAEFLALFKDDTPRYAVVDFEYDFPGGDGRHKLVFITWVPEGAGIHDKSYYTSNKDHLYRTFEDISLHVQAHDLEELSHAKILSQFKAL